MIHSQRRIIAALQLAPMTAEQLSRCLMLHRRTVELSASNLFARGKVIRYAAKPRKRVPGPTPYIYEVAA